MTRRILCGVAMAALSMLALGSLVGPARAGDDKGKIDCADTDLGFAVPGYSVECSDLSDSAVSTDHDLAAERVKKLFAIDSSAGLTFLTAVDITVLGGRVYMQRVGLFEEIQNHFDQTEITDWQDVDAVAGFDTAQFVGIFRNGPRLDCVGFRRVVNRQYEGIGREVFGIACSSNGHRQASEALQHLKAPGA